jgi:hypothetical protein
MVVLLGIRIALRRVQMNVTVNLRGSEEETVRNNFCGLFPIIMSKGMVTFLPYLPVLTVNYI